MSDLVVEPELPFPRRRLPRRGARVLLNSVRVVALVASTFGLLAGGIYLSSTSACRVPCRLDGSGPSRLAAVDAGARGKVPSAPEHNTANPPPPVAPLPPSKRLPSPQDKDVAPASSRRGDIGGSPLRPSVGMRSDLPPIDKPMPTASWTSTVHRDGPTR